MVTINSEFVGLALSISTECPNISSIKSQLPLFHDTSMACLIALSTLYNKDNTCYDKKTTSNYKSLYLNDLSRDELIRIIIEKDQEIAKLKRKVKKSQIN